MNHTKKSIFYKSVVKIYLLPIVLIFFVSGIFAQDIPEEARKSFALGQSAIEIADDSIKTGDYEIHEWGVLIGCNKNDNYFNTSRPKLRFDVKQPVIYVHSNDKIPFNLKVIFNDGKPTSVYPETKISENTTGWNFVNFEEVRKKNKETPDTLGFKKLGEIMDTLNNVDADRLFYKNTSSNFLYYEGEMKFENRIDTKINAMKNEVVVTNNFTYSVYNVILSTATGGYMHPVYLCGKIDEITPGGTFTVNLIPFQSVNWINDLTSIGFTNLEASAFSNLWGGPFLEKSNANDWVNLIYRIPQEELEKMITLKFDPIPKKILRALYVLIYL